MDFFHRLRKSLIPNWLDNSLTKEAADEISEQEKDDKRRGTAIKLKSKFPPESFQGKDTVEKHLDKIFKFLKSNKADTKEEAHTVLTYAGIKDNYSEKICEMYDKESDLEFKTEGDLTEKAFKDDLPPKEMEEDNIKIEAKSGPYKWHVLEATLHNEKGPDIQSEIDAEMQEHGIDEAAAFQVVLDHVKEAVVEKKLKSVNNVPSQYIGQLMEAVPELNASIAISKSKKDKSAITPADPTEPVETPEVLPEDLDLGDEVPMEEAVAMEAELDKGNRIRGYVKKKSSFKHVEYQLKNGDTIIINDWKISRGYSQTLDSPEEPPELELIDVVWGESSTYEKDSPISDEDWDALIEPEILEIEDAIWEHLKGLEDYEPEYDPMEEEERKLRELDGLD